MKFVQLFSISWLALAFFAMTVAQPELEKESVLQAEIAGCNTIHLYEYQGFGFSVVQTATAAKDQFSFHVPQSGARFYYIGPNAGDAVPIILGSEDTVRITAHCNRLREMAIANSPMNEGYREVMKSISDFNKGNAALRDSMQVSAKSKEKATTFFKQLQAADQSWLQFMEKVKQENPFLGGILSLNTFLNFQYRRQNAEDGPDQYYTHFFQFADFENTEVYANIPWTVESFKNYTSTLIRLGLGEDDINSKVETALGNVPQGSGAQKMAYAGVLSAMKENMQPAGYVHFGEEFDQLFAEMDPRNTEIVRKETARARGLILGGTAPDFTQQTPEDTAFSLSALRGKVVLIDFWASWCRPCRAENPNVVRVYQKYKDKGFEILGVSLDHQKERWMKAIEADHLEWKHVSDLKGWKNEVAQTYWVHSIPQTLLIDPDGKILARNLRGRSLEEKLAELFEQ